jgi:hypothetical protein
MGKERNSRGQFMRGNTIGEDTRFREGHDFSNKYKEEYCDKIIEYFSKPVTRTEYKEILRNGEVVAREPIEFIEPYPTFEGFAVSIGVVHDTLLEWQKVHPQFRTAYIQAKNIQYDKLSGNTVIGRYNPVFAKFLAVNNFGMSDKQEVESKVQAKVESGIDAKTLAMIERVSKRIENERKD